MAGPPSPESQSVTANGSSYEAEPAPSQHTDEQAYQVDIMTESIPTKAGNEDTWLYDSDRPVSAGTTGTGGYDVDVQSDDDAVLAQYDNTRAQPTIIPDAAEPSAEGNFVPKPMAPDVPHASESFSFEKARRPSMNFTPTRQAPPFQTLPTPRMTDDREAGGGGPVALNSRGMLSRSNKSLRGR